MTTCLGTISQITGFDSRTKQAISFSSRYFQEIDATQMVVEGDFFSNRPILLIHDKSALAKLDSPGRASSFHSFELDQSDLR